VHAHHPDHVGMAGWLTRRFDCPFWMTRLEYVTCRMLSPTPAARRRGCAALLPGIGWKSYRPGALQSALRRLRKMSTPCRTVTIGCHTVINFSSATASGTLSSDGPFAEHLCLYCPQLRLLISGDQVLPRITSNVSVFPTEPDADPLKEWLDPWR